MNFLPPRGRHSYDPEMGGTGAGAAAREAWTHVVRLFTSEENQRAFLQAAGSLELTPAGLRALLGLLPDEMTAMGVLAQQWHCDPSNVTAIVDQLEQRGFVERRVSPTDRRVKTVALTDAGTAARRRAVERLSDPPAGFEALSVDEQQTLCELLRKVTAELPSLR
jgi:DNA-binding MarR family transcriptional regulator